MMLTDIEIDMTVRHALDVATQIDEDASTMLAQRLLGEVESRAQHVPRRVAARRARRPWRPVLLAAGIAAAVLAAVALSPADRADEPAPIGTVASVPHHVATPRPRVLRAIPGIETASAREVLTRVADTMRDTGHGPWEYLRKSAWSEDWHGYSADCAGDDCTWVSSTGARIDTKPDFPLVRTFVWERWSDGSTELGRADFQHPVSHPCDGKPSPEAPCLGNTAIWLRGRTRPHFPRDAKAGAAELNRLVAIRNDMVARASARSGRFGTSKLSATEVGFWLLTEPVYHAADRANIIRVLAAWPGAKNLGPVIDHQGRRGVKLQIPLYHSYGDPRREPITGYFTAIFDVRHGNLLEYTQRESIDAAEAVGGGYISIEAQSRQEHPTPSNIAVPNRDFG
jgi:hypothetical protein